MCPRRILIIDLVSSPSQPRAASLVGCMPPILPAPSLPAAHRPLSRRSRRRRNPTAAMLGWSRKGAGDGNAAVLSPYPHAAYGSHILNARVVPPCGDSRRDAAAAKPPVGGAAPRSGTAERFQAVARPCDAESRRADPPVGNGSAVRFQALRRGVAARFRPRARDAPAVCMSRRTAPAAPPWRRHRVP